MRRLALIVAVLSLFVAACGDDDGDDHHHTPDSGMQQPDAGAADAAPPDAGPTVLRACLDDPAEALPSPPTGILPCELIPPGVEIILP